MRLTDLKSESALPREGWILYDGGCGFCFRWVNFWRKTVEAKGFAIKDLQSASAEGLLQVSGESLLDEVRVLTRSGKSQCGADAYLYVARRIWWAWPFYATSAFQGLIGFFGRAMAGSIAIGTESLATVRCHRKPLNVYPNTISWHVRLTMLSCEF